MAIQPARTALGSEDELFDEEEGGRTERERPIASSEGFADEEPSQAQPERGRSK